MRVGPFNGTGESQNASDRYDAFDRDTSNVAGAPAPLERDYVAGVSWLLYGSGVRLQANYVRRVTDLPVRRDMVLLDFQTAW